LFHLESPLRKEGAITLQFKATIFTDETRTGQVCNVTSKGDIAENLCELAVVDYSGSVLCNIKLKRQL